MSNISKYYENLEPARSRGYSNSELKMMAKWLRKNKPKKVGLDIDIMEYSRNVTLKQSKIGTNNGYEQN